MDGLYEWITNPATIINFVVVVFTAGTLWANLNNKLKKAEEDIKEMKSMYDKIDITKIETKLAKIEADLEWLKNAWADKHN